MKYFFPIAIPVEESETVVNVPGTAVHFDHWLLDGPSPQAVLLYVSEPSDVTTKTLRLRFIRFDAGPVDVSDAYRGRWSGGGTDFLLFESVEP